MTRLPTPTAIAHLTGSLRNLNRKPAKGQRTILDDLELRLTAAVERDRAGSPIPDGYPTGTLGGGGGRPGPGSTVETTVLALDGRQPRDHHHELTVRAIEAIEAAVLALNTARSALASIDDLTRTTGPAPRTCAHCTPHLPKAHARVVHSRGTVGDRLPTALDLCEPCYFFVNRSTPHAGRHDGQLPTEQQIRWHDQHGTWRIRVA